MSTVVLAGAGFSKALSQAAGVTYPVSSEILSEKYLGLSDFAPRPRSSATSKWFVSEDGSLASVLRSDFGALYRTMDDCEMCQAAGWIDARTNTIVNFELVYSHYMLQAANPILSHNDRDGYRKAINETAGYLLRLLDCAYYLRSERAKEGFLAGIDSLPNDTYICSTNFDNLLEQGLAIAASASGSFSVSLLLPDDYRKPQKVEPTVRIELNRKTLSFDKIHGGINFHTCTNDKCVRYQIPQIRLGQPSFTGECPLCGAETTLGLLPPTLQKDYSISSYYSRCLKSLMNHLQWAENFIIIGYSFPEYDTVLTTTVVRAVQGCLRKGLRIVIVNPREGEKIKSYLARMQDRFASARTVETLGEACSLLQ